jgi:hypothetical protein
MEYSVRTWVNVNFQNQIKLLNQGYDTKQNPKGTGNRQKLSKTQPNKPSGCSERG